MWRQTVAWRWCSPRHRRRRVDVGHRVTEPHRAVPHAAAATACRHAAAAPAQLGSARLSSSHNRWTNLQLRLARRPAAWRTRGAVGRKTTATCFKNNNSDSAFVFTDRVKSAHSTTPTPTPTSSRGCWCRCRRRGMRALASTGASAIASVCFHYNFWTEWPLTLIFWLVTKLSWDRWSRPEVTVRVRVSVR